MLEIKTCMAIKSKVCNVLVSAKVDHHISSLETWN